MSIFSKYKLFFRIVVTVILVVAFILLLILKKNLGNNTIKIGVVHALTGTIAISGKPLVDAITLAVEEINQNGGLLGRNVEIVLVDGKSDNAVSAAESERLIKEKKISALFACWASSCRKAVKPIVEKYNHLLLYAVQYEGLEESPNIVYMGSTPNQQIIPGVKWMMNRFGKKVFLVGSDYIFPRLANVMVVDLVKGFNGSIVGEKYFPLGSSEFSSVAEQIRKSKPDIVINTINGDSNVHFFRALKNANLQKIPIMSFSLSESEMTEMGPEAFFENHFSAWNYFESINTDENKQFVERFKKRFGQNRVTSAPIVNAYNSVNLWAQTVRRLETDDVAQVNRAILHQSRLGPDGMLALDLTSRHLWQKNLIGQADSNGQFKILLDSVSLIRPEPYPLYRTRKEWKDLIEKALNQMGVM